MPTLKKLLKLLIIFFFLFAIIEYFTRHGKELDLLKGLRAFDIIFLFMLTFVSYVFYSYALLLILKKQDLNGIGQFQWFKIFIVSRFINFHVTQGANLYRSFILKKEHNFPYVNYISTVSFLAWFYTATTFAFSVLVILYFNPRLELFGLAVLPWLTTVTLLGFITPYFLVKINIVQSSSNKFFFWFTDRCAELVKQARLFLNSPSLLVMIALLSFFHFILNIMMISIAFLGMGINVSIEGLSLFTVIMTLSKYINIVPNNIGVTEYICGQLSSSLGENLGGGILASGVLRVIEYIFVCAAGALLLKTVDVKAKLRGMEKEGVS